jgi:hypothetical protein
MRVTTTRAVREGEPLTFDYVNSVPLEQKRAVLLKQYGFRCLCPRCRKLCALVTCNKVGDKYCPCGRASYCGQEHQRADWARHKAHEHVMS